MTARVVPIRNGVWRTSREVTRDLYALLDDIRRFGQPAGGLDSDVDTLVRKGLIRAEGERWVLTDAGKLALTCHENEPPPPRGAA